MGASRGGGLKNRHCWARARDSASITLFIQRLLHSLVRLCLAFFWSLLARRGTITRRWSLLASFLFFSFLLSASRTYLTARSVPATCMQHKSSLRPRIASRSIKQFNTGVFHFPFFYSQRSPFNAFSSFAFSVLRSNDRFLIKTFFFIIRDNHPIFFLG